MRYPTTLAIVRASWEARMDRQQRKPRVRAAEFWLCRTARGRRSPTPWCADRSWRPPGTARWFCTNLHPHRRRPAWLTKSTNETIFEIMTTVNVHEAKTQLSRLLERVRAGEEIVIAKAGAPCARLVPLDPPPERVLGRYRDRDGEVPDSVFEPLDAADLAAWEGQE